MGISLAKWEEFWSLKFHLKKKKTFPIILLSCLDERVIETFIKLLLFATDYSKHILCIS